MKNDKIIPANWEILFKWINKIISPKHPITFTINLDGKRPVLNSSDIVNECGVFNKVLSTSTIDVFNFNALENGFWGTLVVCFETFNKGSNGIIFAEFTYSTVNGWSAMDYSNRKWMAITE